ncbi:hypothetical protein [Amycolatopsis thermoflava]|uniref:hypothetical protein n=1 Tax=Amycolatopsis thermoflava TaxID=84480 RepID=UPI0003FA08C3|nr:hypothetical protein [Amycolatopsis thermoflava]
MNDTTNPPTGQGMNHDDCRYLEQALRQMRDDYLADAAFYPSLRREAEARARTMRSVLSELHRWSNGQYGEPYTYPETEKK